MTQLPADALHTIPPCPTEDAPAMGPTHPALNQQTVSSIDRIGDYKILGILGTGGMGIVYKALDETLGGRIVALKMLQVGADADTDELVRFRGEAETLGRLQHPHIVQVFDFGMHEGAPYLVLEYVNGSSLDRKLQGQPLPPRKAAELVEILARAMHVAHEQGIIHRDLKPANIMLTAEGMPKITDFGLAKNLQFASGLTQTGAVMGTPSYMAPEQAAGKKDVGRAADVYSLGAILYELMTGRPPFKGETLAQTLEQVQFHDPAPPSRIVPKLPPDLQSVCLTCLHKAPGRRYATSQALADELKNFLDGLPVKARPTNSLERLIRVVTRRPLRAALVGSGILVFILAIILGLVVRNNQLDREHEAEMVRQQKETEDANRAREEANRSVKNIREMLDLTMAGDMNTPKGLDRVESKLNEHMKQEVANLDRKRALAVAFSRLATLWKDQGELDRAMTNLKTSIDLVEAAAAAEQGGDVSLATALQRPRGYQERSYLLAESSPKDAVQDGETALKLLDELKPEHKKTDDYKRIRAETLHNLAVALANLNNAGETRHQSMLLAEAKYREAEGLLRDLVGQQDLSTESLSELDQDTRDLLTKDLRNLARTLGYLGDIYLNIEKCHEADAVYWMSHRIRASLANVAGLREYEPKFQLARSWDNFARSQAQQRNLVTAIHFYMESLRLRDELNKKQPDNKEYVVELTGVLNRIAELELFVADPQSDVNKNKDPEELKKQIEEAKGRLVQCATLLNDVLSSLRKDDTRHDWETAARMYSRLGECLALQARAALIRLPLLPKEKQAEAVDEAKTAARTAGEAFQKVEDRRAKAANGTQPSSSAPEGVKAERADQSKLTREELYQQAAARIMTLELYQRTSNKPNENLESFYKQWCELLDVAIDRGFRRLSPREIRRDRAFRSVLDKPWFQSTEKKYQEMLNPQAPKPGSQSTQTNGEPASKSF